MTQYLDLEGLKKFKEKADEAYLPTKGTIPLTDKINLTTETKLTLASKYAKVANNGLNFYVVADSSGKLPSSETRININSSITSLVGAEGANVGDLFVVGKLDLKPVYKIIPLNDAKAENSSYKGTQGVVTPWDKAQINKVPNMESAISAAKNNLPTYSESNMNNALKTGFYPWCTLGRPSGSTGAYTLVTLASTTADNNGYTTIEQTAYGRQNDELGKIYKRIIFKPSSGDVEFGKWKEVTTELTTSNMDKELLFGLVSGDGISYLNATETICGILNGTPTSLYAVTVQRRGGISIYTPRTTYTLDINRAISLGILKETQSSFHRIYKKALRINSYTYRNIYIQRRLMISGFEPNKKYVVYINGEIQQKGDLILGVGSPKYGYKVGVENGIPYFTRIVKNGGKENRYSMMRGTFDKWVDIMGYYVENVEEGDDFTKIYITSLSVSDSKPDEDYFKYNNYIVYKGNTPSVPIFLLREIVIDKVYNHSNDMEIYRNHAIVVYGLRTRNKKSKEGYFAGENIRHSNWTRQIKKQNIIKVVFYKRGIPIKHYILKYTGDHNQKQRYYQTPKIIG